MSNQSFDLSPISRRTACFLFDLCSEGKPLMRWRDPTRRSRSNQNFGNAYVEANWRGRSENEEILHFSTMPHQLGKILMCRAACHLAGKV